MYMHCYNYCSCIFMLNFMNTFCTYMYLVLIDGYWVMGTCAVSYTIISFRLVVVAVDFLGHGDSKAPNQPN